MRIENPALIAEGGGTYMEYRRSRADNPGMKRRKLPEWER
jgi:hypothetical protein